MTVIEIFTLILMVFFVAVAVGYSYSKHKGSLKDMVQDVKDIEVQAEQVANELYNKDLRPIVAKKAPKKDKVTEQVESMKKVVEAHDTLVEEINKISLQPTAVEIPEGIIEQPVKKEAKPEFPIDKPKKKRKYYPRKK